MIIRLRYFLTITLATAALTLPAQKIKVGACTTADGGEYQGEMVGGKPDGRGRATYKNGDWYEGLYSKGKRQGRVLILFPMVKNMRENGSKITSMALERSISKTIISM